ncbi:hypothetical protein GW17_00003609 [Ensete ventricosum]|nr:hypothetical protein GW17_00003609 [Ensete ventricosum]RZR79377.1 hypothetical protein BHM03_00005094 [Ensete ventricosum]
MIADGIQHPMRRSETTLVLLGSGARIVLLWGPSKLARVEQAIRTRSRSSYVTAFEFSVRSFVRPEEAYYK